PHRALPPAAARTEEEDDAPQRSARLTGARRGARVHPVIETTIFDQGGSRMSLRWYRRPRMVALRPNRPGREAARALEQNNIGAVLVIHDGKLAGIVTDRDLAVRALGQGLDPNTPISKVMTPNVITLPSNASPEDALLLM